ncbi:MAG: DUF3108 domain-containing protein [Dysgonamonadaceae bacterium]|jgi:hypothetical protein|nr:DUF3108 domain-containing protein [Dysgonamonadaceae bacterium]MDD3309735.1 DUF3108 domain-containing protein [Dysgonamonadaceae bacterium]MDD3900079.1 DUF3108 domain-containing protein [Dysgonamonadaceae bacterium]MDD4399449.1 DUF3108 domain-containing protein [Dysgonamonadaceae bacterium]MEA5081696.1 DUF3108 domain-containing protein [Dysgonamonadaceae bacterium]
MKKIYTILLSIVAGLLFFQTAVAQCKMKNTAFNGGENIYYNLYYRYGLINAKGGVGALITTNTNYSGQDAYKISLMLNTTGMVGNIYNVQDTLLSFVNKNLQPLLFTKDAFEGSDYSKERQLYTYNGSSISVRAMRKFNGNLKFDEVVTTNKCTYDYLSLIAYARNLDFTGMRPGENMYVQFLSGRNFVNMYIRYKGTSRVKADNGKTYDAIQLAMIILDDAFEDKEEAIHVSLSNDSNKVPIIIDTKLKIGSIRAVMKSCNGLRN